MLRKLNCSSPFKLELAEAALLAAQERLFPGEQPGYYEGFCYCADMDDPDYHEGGYQFMRWTGEGGTVEVRGNFTSEKEGVIWRIAVFNHTPASLRFTQDLLKLLMTQDVNTVNAEFAGTSKEQQVIGYHLRPEAEGHECFRNIPFTQLTGFMAQMVELAEVGLTTLQIARTQLATAIRVAFPDDDQLGAAVFNAICIHGDGLSFAQLLQIPSLEPSREPAGT